MKKKTLRSKLIRLLIVLFCFIILGLIVWFLLAHDQQGLTRRAIRQTGRFIRSFGMISPLVVIFLVWLSTVVPPLPLPVPLIEIAAGVVFGFGEGFFVVWISHIVSSLFAFYLIKLFRKHVFTKLLQNKNWHFYREFIKRKGSQAVFITRFTMSAPFNIVSYFAGLTKMSTVSFLIATALGTIPESALYTFIGSKLRGSHISLVNVFILVTIIGICGVVIAFLFARFVQHTFHKKTLR